MKHQDDITVKGRIAVWVGSFTDELEADDYLNIDCGFERDFGFQISERRGPEIDVRPSAVPIRNLIEGFSGSKDYADAVVDRADRLGVGSACSMLIFHWLAYDERMIKNPAAPLRYLGNFDFGDPKK